MPRASTTAAIAAALAVCGVIAGKVVAITMATTSGPEFRLEDSPRRGMGRPVVEFFDPACGASREMHRHVSPMLRDYLHILVPVALAPADGSSPGEMLCRIDPQYAFDAVDALLVDGPSVLAAFPRKGSIDDCRRKVEAAAQETGRLTEGTATTPVFVFDGRVYRGLDSLASLEQSLRRRK